jgi:hypothetical protein
MKAAAACTRGLTGAGIMPDIVRLPEGLSAKAFAATFHDTRTPAYQDITELIERRLDALTLSLTDPSQGVRTAAQTSTDSAPAWSRTRLSSVTVAPVVTTSSRMATRAQGQGLRAIKAPRMLRRRAASSSPA